MAVLVLLLAAVVSWPSGKDEPSPEQLSCEPGAPLEVHAALVSKTISKKATRVRIDLRILSRADRPLARVRARRGKGPGKEMAAAGPERELSLPGGRPATLRYDMDLEPGRQHHLFFRVESGDPDFPDAEATAYLSVDLDPSRQPERIGRLIQYRARQAGDSR